MFKTKTWHTYPVVILSLLAFTVYRLAQPEPPPSQSRAGPGRAAGAS